MTSPLPEWRPSLREVVVAAALGGAALLLLEIRYEHREVLGETWRAWVPLVTAALLLVAGGGALIRFRAGGRRVLVVLFGLALAVGALGIWFHSDGHPLDRIAKTLSAWRLAPGDDGGEKIGERPPPLAPAAFCGLGVIGLAACLAPGGPPERDG